ncbi:hypothetical protein [Streptomyces sp. HNM0574]|uniref:hypothetical protein n=1 Tax=Streptomyces sp. HNM0574 TaxID=2714954 RepID=UPI00146B522C|nr:hypothetical protein [Streptomyces sp. HNM0574]NLU71022.1 hypothetical protein [Streptomyces sp. HNM0574]
MFDTVRGTRPAACACPRGTDEAAGGRLTESEAALLERQDLRGLFTAGVHPVLVNAYARSIGKARDEYREILAGTLTTSEREVRWRP